MRKYAKVDANQAEIVKAFRKAGATVQSLATIGNGCPDLLVGYASSWALVEVKDGTKPPSQRELTADQKDWWAAHKGSGGFLAVVSEERHVAILLELMRHP